MVDSIVLQNMEQLWSSPAGTYYTKYGQQSIPKREDSTKLKSWSTLHVMLTTKDENHVNSTVVKSICPVFDHPYS